MLKKISILLFSILLLILNIPAVMAGNEKLSHDGKLRFFHTHFRQFIEIEYEVNKKLKPEALEKLNYFFRSRDSGEVKKVSLDLIYLMDHLQDHFQADTIELISGYRSPTFNRHLKSIGRNVSDKSNHMKAWACDIHFDEITEKSLWEYVKSLKLGGAGYYPDINMVHVDVGELKVWKEGYFTDRTDIGFFYEKPNIEIRSDKLFYFDGQKQELSIQENDYHIKSKLLLKKFYRGKWRNVAQISLKNRQVKDWLKNDEPLIFHFMSKVKKVDSSQEIFENKKKYINLNLDYGRYRWKVETDKGEGQFSNEFYLKRI